jgi:hypothetical protein
MKRPNGKGMSSSEASQYFFIDAVAESRPTHIHKLSTNAI